MKGEGYLGRNRKMTVIRCRPSLVGGSGFGVLGDWDWCMNWATVGVAICYPFG